MLNNLIIKEKGFYKSFIALVIPIALQNLITYTLNFMDTLMLGFLGENELAASSLANVPFFVFSLFVFGLISGSNVMISQYWGKGDRRTINSIIGLGLISAFAISAIVACGIFLFPRQVMRVLTNDKVLIDLGSKYIKIVSVSYVFTAITAAYTGTMRSLENVRIGLLVNCVGVLSNILFNWILILGKLGAPALGMEGAAIATVIARIIELLIVIIYEQFFNRHFKLDYKALLRPHKKLISDFIRFATPVVMNETLWSAGTSMYALIFGRMSPAIVAGHTIAMNVDRFFQLVLFAFAHAAAVMVGKEIGLSKTETAYKKARFLLVLSFTYGIFSGVLMIITRRVILDFFNVSEQARYTAALLTLILAILLPMRTFNTCNIVGILRAGGDVRFALLSDILPLWFLSVPLTFLTALVFELPLIIVFSVMLFEEIIKFVVGLWRFKSRRWMRNITREFVA